MKVMRAITSPLAWISLWLGTESSYLDTKPVYTVTLEVFNNGEYTSDWSLDGRMHAMDSRTDYGCHEVFIISADGSNWVNQTNTPAND